MATAPKKIKRGAIIASLSEVAAIPKDILDSLAVPPELYDLSRDGKSYSSDAEVPASVLNGCFFLGLPLPKKIPDYAIDLSMKGSTLFCTLVDKKRKIIANAQVSSLQDPDSGWEALWLCIRSALAEKNKSAGKKFGFVLSGDDMMKTV